MKNITLQIEPGKAREIHRTAAPDLRTILEASAPAGFFSQKITDRIKTYEDACAELGVEPIKQHVFDELADIAAALNEGWVPDWSDDDQKKWAPWFDLSSGFAFGATGYGYSAAYAGGASRLCFKSAELARYAGEQFIDRYEKLIKTPHQKRS